MMKLKYLFPIFLVFLFKLVAAFDVSPVIIEQTVSPGEIKITQIQVTNTDTNATHSYVLSVTGPVSNIILLEDNDFKLPAGTSKVIKVYFIAPEDISEGTYTGYINVNEIDTNATAKQIYVRVTVNPWVFSTEKWVSIPSRLIINGYPINVTYTSDRNCLLLNGIQACRDDMKIFQNKYRIKVLDINRDNDQAYLRIESKDRNTYVTVEEIKKKEEELEGTVRIIPDYVEKRIQQGIKSTSIILYVYNLLDRTISIERITYYGDIYEYEDGTKEPVYDITVPNRIVEPGEQVPIIVKLASTKLDPGKYTISLNVYYKYAGKLKTKTAVLTVTVFRSQAELFKEVEIYLPNSITRNKNFEIEIKGLKEGMDVEIESDPENCISGNLTTSGATAKYVGKVICDASKVTLTVKILKDGSLVKSVSKEYSIGAPVLKKMIIKISPPNPKPGDTVTITVVDENGFTIEGADIKVNGQPMTSFIAEPKKTYNIVAEKEGYITAKKTITIPGKKFKVIITPPIQNITIGTTVTINVYDKDTNAPVQATITVNGQPIQGNTFTVNREGTYTIVVTSPQYDAYTTRFTVTKPLEVYLPPEFKEGEPLNITANKPVIFTVYYISENGPVEVYSSTNPEKKLMFVPTKPGTYKVEAGGKEYFIEVKGGVSLGGDIRYILLILVIAIIVYAIARRRKKREKKEEIFVRPPSAAGLGGYSGPATPLSESEEKAFKGGG